jgi:hypothetical protein
MSRLERTQKALQEAITAVDEALASGMVIDPNWANWGAPETIDVVHESTEHLLAFKDNLQLMFQDILTDNSTQKRAPVTPLGRLIADSWPVDLALGDIILKAEHEYRAFRKMRVNRQEGD